MRQLATIQRIKNIQPIEGRDRIMQADILGWRVIIGKDFYQENDLVCFFEIDSVFPKIEPWSELEKFKYRIKTFKVNTSSGPIYGQGYCIPFTKFKEVVDNHTNFWDVLEDKSYVEWKEGDDVTKLLGITKYEPPVGFASGDAKGNFPTHLIPQTDETRVQAKMSVLDELKGKFYYITQKADGTSMTVIAEPNGDIHVCSRNLSIKYPDDPKKKSVYWAMFEKYNFKEILKEFPTFGFQMEVVGPGIQKNPMGLEQPEIRLFNIYSQNTKKYLDWVDVRSIMIYIWKISPDLKWVDVIEEGDYFEHDLNSLINLSNHLYESGKPAEGIVIRPQLEMYSPSLKGRLSFKQISPEFLCKGGN